MSNGMPTPTLPDLGAFKNGPVAVLAEIRTSLGTSMAGIEDKLPTNVKVPLASARTNIGSKLAEFESKLPQGGLKPPETPPVPVQARLINKYVADINPAGNVSQRIVEKRGM